MKINLMSIEIEEMFSQHLEYEWLTGMGILVSFITSVLLMDISIISYTLLSSWPTQLSYICTALIDNLKPRYTNTCLAAQSWGKVGWIKETWPLPLLSHPIQGFVSIRRDIVQLDLSINLYFYVCILNIYNFCSMILFMIKLKILYIFNFL